MVRIRYPNLKQAFKFMRRNQLLVQSRQTGLLVATGDVIAQSGVEKRKRSDFDFERMASQLV